MNTNEDFFRLSLLTWRMFNKPAATVSTVADSQLDAATWRAGNELALDIATGAPYVLRVPETPEEERVLAVAWQIVDYRATSGHKISPSEARGFSMAALLGILHQPHLLRGLLDAYEFTKDGPP